MSRLTNSVKGIRGAVITLALVMIAGSPLPLKAQSAIISGVLKNNAGEPVAGALVKVRSEGTGLGFIVVSQEQGRYSTPNLLPGKYNVQGFGGAYQGASAEPVEVSSGQHGKVDLVLSAPLQILPREKRFNDDDYDKLMPAAPAKRFASDQCATCHTLLWVVSSRKTREQWQHVYDRMLDDLYDLRKLMIYHQPSENSDLVLSYLAKNYGPDTPPDPRVVKQLLIEPGGPSHPNRNLPSALLKGAAGKYIAMEFSLPPGAEPHDIAVDSKGIVWVSEKNTGMFGRFDPSSLTYTRIAAPPGKHSKPQTNAITVDEQDQVWFADDGPNGRIIHYDPKSQAFSRYLMPEYKFLTPPDAGWARIQQMRVSNGTAWALGFTSSRILKLDIAGGKVMDYSIPKGSLPFGMVVDKDDSVWYSAFIPSQVVKLEASTGKLTKYYVPLEEKERADLRGMASDAEGNLWIGASEIGKLLKLDSHSGHYSEYTPPTQDAGPFTVDVDTKRNLIWFSEAFTDRIARFDPRTGAFVEFSGPSADADVERIEVDPTHPNRVWWAGNRTGKIGYIETIE